ncbi:TPA: helix-turn-helix domain-containing protein [Clostridioides difficile]|uniref:helix-turn-helix domain-containing protein n=1 Tax=unclassified Clostridioides TaxID=2635829 RepID=UPI0018C21512|nr:XRE family transcriptional regulator [Clostridioides difficile]MCC0641605.1 helix-turn-helix transcriptional regulator [Clostridioides sp. ES-S-0049-03]MCC0677321.1 helix-turn-helix transcriptional regulator [Clostridioides sp. ES-W-0018-02]MCC0712470.1 helix-turn-helix transcriptional regulator [Clostridioides sp. ES-W-0017-02]EGT4836507.1 XRE family transcriptional regulator [Clostridioides difficile]
MFSENLKTLRIKNKLTQEELAEKLCISRSALSLYELNKRKPDFDTLIKISKFFNVSVDSILGDIAVKKEPSENITNNIIEIDEDVKKLTDIIFELDKEDREVIWHMLDALIKKNK